MNTNSVVVPKHILVTIGVPHTKKVIFKKAYFEPEELKGDTIIQKAKLIRKFVSEHLMTYGFPSGIKFRPSELYFMVERVVTGDEKIYFPIVASSQNAPCVTGLD